MHHDRPYDAMRRKVPVVDPSFRSRDFDKPSDLGRGPSGTEFERPYSDLGHGVMGQDWEEGISYARMREQRLQKAKDALAKTDMDALLIFRLENIRYLTGFRNHGFPMMFWGIASCVLPQGGEPLLFTMDIDHCKLRMPWVADTSFPSPGGGLESEGGAERWLKEVLEKLSDLGIKSPKKLGVDSWSTGMFSGFPKAAPKMEWGDAQGVMLQARAIKTWDEIQCLKMANALTVAGVQAGLEALRPGVKECHVRGAIYETMDHLGSEGSQTTNCIVCSGGATAPYRRFTSDRIIDYGDLVIIDMGACFNGYYGDFTRTFICGDARPTRRQVELHTSAYNALRKAEAAIKPGNTTYEVGTAAGEWVLGGLLGHGLGVAGVELPFVGTPELVPKEAATPLEPGMCFSLEPYAGEVGVGGFRLEDGVVVTEKGCEIVTKFPFDERLIDESLLEGW